MSQAKAIRTTASSLLFAWLVLISTFAAAQLRADEEKSLFGQTKVWSIDLEISAKEFEAMQPPQPGGFGPAPPVQGERASERSLFGTEFRWARADFPRLAPGLDWLVPFRKKPKVSFILGKDS